MHARPALPPRRPRIAGVPVATLVAALAPLALLAAPAPPAAAAAAGPTLRLERLQTEPTTGRSVPTPAALERLAQRVADKPGDRAARFDLVRALMETGDLPAALEAARAWRVHDAYNLVVVRLLGDIYSVMGHHAVEARRAYSAVVELLPEDPAAHRALASVLKLSGDHQGAYDRLATALSLRPTDRRLAFELADAAQRLGRAQEAARRFRALVEEGDTPKQIRYPAKQRLAQLLSARRRAAQAAGDAPTASALAAQIDALKIHGGVVNDIKIYLTWDTDRSDVDLWVDTPSGQRVSYKKKKGRFGAALFDDVTTGYGPESFTARAARPGTYTIRVNYFATNRRRFSEARGEVVVLLHEGTAQEERHVLPYRLFRVKDTVAVARIRVTSTPPVASAAAAASAARTTVATTQHATSTTGGAR